MRDWAGAESCPGCRWESKPGPEAPPGRGAPVSKQSLPGEAGEEQSLLLSERGLSSRGERQSPSKGSPLGRAGLPARWERMESIPKPLEPSIAKLRPVLPKSSPPPPTPAAAAPAPSCGLAWGRRAGSLRAPWMEFSLGGARELWANLLCALDPKGLSASSAASRGAAEPRGVVGVSGRNGREGAPSWGEQRGRRTA